MTESARVLMMPRTAITTDSTSQHGDAVEGLVDLVGLRLHELGLILDLDVRETA